MADQHDPHHEPSNDRSRRPGDESRSKSWVQHRADLFNQLAPGESMLPDWAASLFVWVMGALAGSIVPWFLFRLFTGAQRGDMTQATISIVCGLIIGTVALILFRKSRAR
ncbi:hypothetical protein [Auritidibacter sp. NML100628]|uniref:hypothetical protein n=1 Tax=Auritidibacter sp. NML100628 TaxID=2170742 RepID=UPI000D72DC6D|nr:hypothetical protein [Auritidibacter sp. NML100628]PXA78278.1 hypothetical protein DCC24_00920 [Auritidibacter sp. NML100628]